MKLSSTGLQNLRATSLRGQNMWEEFDFAEGMFRYCFYQNDFIKYSDYDVTNEWTLTQDAVAGGTVVLSDDIDLGELIITPHTDDNDWCELQFTAANAAGEFVSLAARKALFYEVRVKLVDITQSDAFVGLCITDADIHDSGVGVPEATDYIGFAKDDGDAYWDFVSAKNSTETAKAAAATGVNDTYIILGFYIDGVSKAHSWINGVKGPVITTNLPDDEQLCFTFLSQNGAAAAKVMKIDYFQIARER